MDGTPERYIERLTEISNKKYKSLQDMFLLTMAQSEAINEDGLEGLQKLLDDKQSKIEEINKADEDFNVYYTRLKQTMGINSLAEINTPGIKGVKELQQLIGQIMDLLKEISEIEKQNSDKAKNLLNGLGSKIKEISQGKKVSSAYNSSPAAIPPSYFIDKKK